MNYRLIGPNFHNSQGSPISLEAKQVVQIIQPSLHIPFTYDAMILSYEIHISNIL